jgi:hypothetical protein
MLVVTGAVAFTAMHLANLASCRRISALLRNHHGGRPRLPRQMAQVGEQRTFHPDRKAGYPLQDTDQAILRKNVNVWVGEHEGRQDSSIFLPIHQTRPKSVNDDLDAIRIHQSFLEKRRESSWILTMNEESWSVVNEKRGVMADQSHQAADSISLIN